MTLRGLTMVAAAVAVSGCAALQEYLGEAADPADDPATIAAGLRDALAIGTERAATRLGRRDGYWKREDVRIPLPSMLDRAARYLRVTGNGHLVDQFHESINRAAEQAAPLAVSVFADAITEMTWADAREILHGPDDAATEYFRRVAGHRLAETFYPAVARATQNAGVTQRYKDLVQRAGPLSEFLEPEARDLDVYITGRALNGLFTVLAEEERRIREDPAARTTALLRQVFGAPVLPER